MAGKRLSCPICAEFYTDSSNICSTVCGHIYHLNCLQEWQKRSSKCPICNNSNIQPHRIFLDLEAITSSDACECKIIIKGIPASQMKGSLSGCVLELAKHMNVIMLEYDIEHVHKIGNKLEVKFKTESKKILFLQNKSKLKRNALTSAIVIHEVLDPETKELFEYSHKLKEKGYKTIFVKNMNVFVKKESYSYPINILSKVQVDTLYKEDSTVVQKTTNNSCVLGRPMDLLRTQQIHNSDASRNISRMCPSVSQNIYNFRSDAGVAQRARDNSSECNIL